MYIIYLYSICCVERPIYTFIQLYCYVCNYVYTYTGVAIDHMETKIVLPEGSYNIRVVLPYDTLETRAVRLVCECVVCLYMYVYTSYIK